MGNKKYLNLEEKLLKYKEKYSIIGNNVSFIFSTTEIEKKELYNTFNRSSIILNECEDILKKKYSISEEYSIPILKIEKLNNNSSNIDIFYEFFNPNNLSEKLDLNICSQNYLEIRLPLALKQYKMDLIKRTRDLGYNIFDLNDTFCRDICSIFIYNGSDFSLSERKTLLDLSDENLTMPGCNFTSFDIKTIRIIYLCKIGNDVNNNNYLNGIKINVHDEDSILNQFKKQISFSKASNIEVVKCFLLIFNSKLFSENYGFYIMFSMNIIIILLIGFSFKSKLDEQLKKFCYTVLSQMKLIYNKKQDEIRLKFNDSKIDGNNSMVDDRNLNRSNNNELSCIDISKVENIKETRSSSSQRVLKVKNIKINSKKIKDINPINLEPSSIVKIYNKGSGLLNVLGSNNGQNKYNYGGEDENKIIDELRKKNNSNYYLFYVIKYIPYKKRKECISELEMADLPYDYALKIEDRNKSNCYFSLLREKNKIISIFLNDKDYNIYTVKIALFIFDFNCSLTVNALFFNDEAIHEINQDEGSFKLSTQISIIVYSAVISIALSFPIQLLAFTHKNIIELRYYKDIKKAQDNIPKLVGTLKKRIIAFFIIIIIFDIIFFYYITAFCTVYSIIQIHMIRSTLMSFLLTNSYSIILYMVSSFIRIFSLKKKSRFRFLLYLISWIISLI